MMWYDGVVLAIVVLATIRGAIKGFVWQLASIAALVASFAFAESVSVRVAPHIAVDPPLNRWIAMLGLYVVCIFVTFLIARKLRGWIEKAKFVEFDRHLGLLFGFVKGVAFALVVTFFAVTLSAKTRAHVFETRSGYMAAIIMDRLHPVMPAELHDVLEPYIHQLDQPDMDLQHADQHAHHDAENNDDHPGHTEHEPHNDESGRERGSGSDDGPGLSRDELILPLDFLENQVGTGEKIQLKDIIQEISGIFTTFPAGQAGIAEDIQKATAGIPDQVVQAVLQDWRSDLLDLGTDPDPETNGDTQLSVRIRRQLQAADIPLTSLSRAVQERLKN